MVLLNTFDLESTLIFAFQVLWAVYFYKSNAVKKSLGEPYWIKNDDGSFYESPWVGANTVPPGTFSHNRGKAHRYCKLCGARLDSDCKCTGCGKQYFHINKGHLLKGYAIIATLLLISSVWLSLHNYRDWLTASEKADILAQDLHVARAYNDTMTNDFVRVDKQRQQLQTDLSELKLLYFALEDEAKFYRENAVFVTPNGTKYHKALCGHMKNSSSYRIYNISAAKGMGYTACADCWK